jgi:hemolysin activation/secretion protein
VQAPPPAPRFEIQRFIVEGNTILPQGDVDALVTPFTGKDRDFGSVQQALEALQDAYLERGYNAVRVLIPEQDLRAGQVRLQVIEARIREVRIEGNQYFDDANVRASFPTLRAGEPPNTRRIAQNAQLANENPAKQSVVRFDAGDKPGIIDATVRVTDEDPRRLSVFVDNSGTRQSGKHRAGIGYQDANFLKRDHVLTAQFITSPDNYDDVKVFGAGYRIPVYAWSGAFDVFAGYSDVDSGTVADLFTVSGSGTILGARYTQILPPVESYQHKAGVGWDYRDFRQNIALIGTTGTLLPDITIRPLSLFYSGRWSRVGQDLSFSASVSHNAFPEGADGGQTAFTANRAGAEPRYTIWRGSASYSHTLPADFLARLALAFQHTNHLLIPGEQFGMGGADSVRGFNEREVSRDRGRRLSAEVYTPDMGSGGWRVRWLAFFDAAWGWDNQPARAADESISSIGAGVRIAQTRGLSFRGDFGLVTSGAPTRPRNSSRVHFTAAYTW